MGPSPARFSGWTVSLQLDIDGPGPMVMDESFDPPWKTYTNRLLSGMKILAMDKWILHLNRG